MLLEQRGVIRFFVVKKASKNLKCIGEFKSQYAENCFAQKNVILLLDKEPPHSAAVTVGAISQLKSEILPPYSPHLAPSHYLMFGPLKESLHG
jgi:transposase